MIESSLPELAERVCPSCATAFPRTLYVEGNFISSAAGGFSFASRKSPELMHYRLYSCSNCALIYASPAPERAWLARAYAEAGFESETESRYAARTYRQYLERYQSRLRGRGSALDIGASDGTFLQELQKLGFNTIVGVEPSSESVARASPHIRSLLRCEMFQRESFSPQSFDLISCFQTLEHVPSPRQLCEDAFALLAPGGLFYAVTHNHLSFVNRALGRYSPIFDIEHLQLFSPQSITRLLESSGFCSIKIVTIWNTYPVNYWLKLAPFSHGFKSSIRTLLERARIGAWPISVNVGNIAVFANTPLK